MSEQTCEVSVDLEQEAGSSHLCEFCDCESAYRKIDWRGDRRDICASCDCNRLGA